MGRLDRMSYETPDDFKCPCCGEETTVVPLDNSFDYAGTHCTGGRGGVEYPSDFGDPVTICCEVEVPDAEIYCPF